ncbi:MAG TPA: diguanylate cyclase [Polyangiales bacterium]|nr:diguanylate cyclase [Polyangiales bacterium]
MKAKLLLVDDNDTQSGKIRSSLERLGYSVECASSGVEGLKLARMQRPDLILLDVEMADLDGFAVCRWLKMNAETREIPVIMLTIRKDVADRVEGLNIGADDYLPKPFADAELEARIFAALRVKAAHAELRERNTQLESMLHHVEALAITDPLTGLYNRRRFADVLKREFAITRRYKNTLSCLMIDLDHFKRINDRFGHDAGDQVVKETARRLMETVREVDVPARYGGEEFAVLLPHTAKRDAVIAAERVRAAMTKAEFSFGDERLRISASIGVAGNDDVTTGVAEDLVKAADCALYEAKRQGRDRVVLFEHSMAISTRSDSPAARG